MATQPRSPLNKNAEEEVQPSHQFSTLIITSYRDLIACNGTFELPFYTEDANSGKKWEEWSLKAAVGSDAVGKKGENDTEGETGASTRNIYHGPGSGGN